MGVISRPVSLLPRSEAVATGGVQTQNNVQSQLNTLQNQVNAITRYLRGNIPQPDSYSVVDRNGKLVAWFGFGEGTDNKVYEGVYALNLWVGPSDPSTAPFFSDGSNVIIGKNGVVKVADDAGNVVSSLGVTLGNPQNIVATSNASPDVLTVPNHGYSNGDLVTVTGATGDTAINSAQGAVADRIVQGVTTNTFTLTDLTPTAIAGNGVYTGSGTVVRQEILTITATTNASPDVITIAGHGFSNGDTVIIKGALGDTAINGRWIVEAVTTNTFQLTDFAGNAVNGNGAYGGSGTAQRYFAGALLQTVAIGRSFADYKLRAFADGSLVIRNVGFTAINGTKEIVLDPSVPELLIEDTSDPNHSNVTIDATNGIVADGGTGNAVARVGIDGTITVYLHGSPNHLSGMSPGTLVAQYDTGKAEVLITADVTGSQIFVIDTGGNTKILLNSSTGITVNSVQVVDTTANVNAATKYSVGGTQVVGSRKAAVSTVGGVAGASYTATEQGMLNNLTTAVNALVNRLQSHGLTS